MRTNMLKLASVICIVVLLVVEVGIIAAAAKDIKKAKGPKGISKGNQKNDDNLRPVVEILEPTDNYVIGNTLTVTVTVSDEDEFAVATITCDLYPTFNSDNTVTIDTSGWDYWSEHIITAVYEDSGGKIGGAHIYVIKVPPR